MHAPRLIAVIGIAIAGIALLAEPALAAAPTARNDRVTTKVGARVVIDVMANDTAAADDTIDPSTLNIDTFPINGDLSLTSNGKLAYKPFAGFVGTESFSYLVCSAKKVDDCATGAVTVTVGSPSDTTTTTTTTIAPPPPPGAAAPVPARSLPNTGSSSWVLAIVGTVLCAAGLTLVRSAAVIHR